MSELFNEKLSPEIFLTNFDSNKKVIKCRQLTEIWFLIGSRVASFYGKNIPNNYKIYQMATQYTK
jgi:hypothetical protein